MNVKALCESSRLRYGMNDLYSESVPTHSDPHTGAHIGPPGYALGQSGFDLDRIQPIRRRAGEF